MPVQQVHRETIKPFSAINDLFVNYIDTYSDTIVDYINMYSNSNITTANIQLLNIKKVAVFIVMENTDGLLKMSLYHTDKASGKSVYNQYIVQSHITNRNIYDLFLYKFKYSDKVESPCGYKTITIEKNKD